MRIPLLRSLVGAALAGLAASAPLAAQTFGGGITSTGAGPFGVDSSDPTVIGTYAETFAAPATSNLLTAFRLYLTDYVGTGSTLSVQASIYQFVTDHIVGSALYTSPEVPGSSNNAGFDKLTFTGVNLMLTAGTTYAVLLRPTASSIDGSTNLFGVSDVESFSLGQLFTASGTSDADLGMAGAFTASDATTFGPDAAIIMIFQPNDVTATPEPGTLALLATGVAGVVGVVSRRRRSRQNAASAIA